jgi:FkbM family methyltransferase
MSVKRTLGSLPLLRFLFGEETSLRFHIAGAIYMAARFPRRTLRIVAKKLTGHNALVRVDACLMEVPIDMFWAFADGTYYEQNVTDWLVKLLSSSPRKVFYDVGANYGYYCLRLAGIAKHIHAFEPAAETHRVLLDNLRRNALTNVRLHKVGLSDRNGVEVMNIYSSSGNNSLFDRAVPRHSTSRLVRRELVDVVTLDGLFHRGELQPPDLIKLDVEGGELHALKGARETLRKYRPALLFEYFEPLCQAAGYSRTELLRELEEHKYTIYGLSSNVTDHKAYALSQFGDVEVGHIIGLPDVGERVGAWFSASD